jgi:hypothetical protein
VELPRLHFPEYNFTIKAANKGRPGFKIFDKIRLKYVALTPEEWVRQHLLTFLLEDLNYPKGLISVEKELKLAGLSKRFDALVYDANHRPALLIECKAPLIKLNQSVFDQAARYNLVLRVPYFLVANGFEMFFCKIDHENGTYDFLEKIPSHEELSSAI